MDRDLDSDCNDLDTDYNHLDTDYNHSVDFKMEGGARLQASSAQPES